MNANSMKVIALLCCICWPRESKLPFHIFPERSLMTSGGWTPYTVQMYDTSGSSRTAT